MALAGTYTYALQPVWEGEVPQLSYITFAQSYHCIVAICAWTTYYDAHQLVPVKSTVYEYTEYIMASL